MLPWRRVATRAKSAPKGPQQEIRAVLDGVRRLVQGLHNSSRDTEKRLGLSAAQLFVLHKLASERGLSVNALAERTLTHQSSVSAVVSRLVEGGFVSRAPSEADRRRVQLSLTRKGRATLEKAPEAAQERLISAIEGLSKAERRVLTSGLAKLSFALTPTETPATMLFADDGPTAKKR